ncbi:MAG: thioredoxin-disulfide reductase [Succinivibrionaceae bacterium]|nr:thioredoxin-disulfide reductase [Succinivibrionaceae bacterium]
MEISNVAVIGSGPAGYTAALYTARANLDPVLITGLSQGGQLTQSSSVENWPGASDFPSGLDLMESMRLHVEKFSVRCVSDDVESVARAEDGFAIALTDGSVINARAVIVATGSSARYLGLPGEDRFRGGGISACATCDGFFFRKKTVAVIGGGNTAVTDALYLSNLAAQTHLIHRRDEFRCEKILTDKLYQAVESGKIRLHLSCVPLSFEGREVLEGVRIRDLKTQEESLVAADGVFEAIGHDPNTGFLGDLVETDGGYIRLHPETGFSTATSVTGIFAAGDVADHRYQQAIVAAGAGCRAALDVEAFLGGRTV